MAKKETQASLLEVSSGHPRTRLSLDQTNAEFVAAFLQGSPHIQGLSIVSNLERHDGAMEVMANTLRDTKNISILCLWGDCDEDDVNRSGAFRVDNGTALECLSLGIPGNTSVKSLRFHFYNFSSLHSNHIHLHQLLVGKRDFKKITFSACDFGSDISLLVEGLAAQRDLQEFSIDMEDYDKKLNDEDLADIIQVISENDVGNRLRILNLYDCGMGAKSLQKLNALLSKKDCRLGGLCLGDCRELSDNLAPLQEFLSVLCLHNHSIQRIRVGCRNQRAFQRILQQCIHRNHLLSHVRGTFEKTLDLGVWGMAVSALASKKSFVGATPLFWALSSTSTLVGKGFPSFPRSKKRRHFTYVR